MLLFSQKETTATTWDKKYFYVISDNERLSDEVVERLNVFGAANVKVIKQDFLLNNQLTLDDDLCGVIIFIGVHDKPDTVINDIQNQVPRHIWCAVIGNKDSITLAQKFASKKVHYFHGKLQLDLLAKTAIDSTKSNDRRSLACISVLGCKGGVGTSLLAYQLANALYEYRNKPLLCIQGGNGSRNLDLIVGKKLSQDIISIPKKSDVMMSPDIGIPDLQKEIFDKYSLVVFEQSIHNLTKDDYRDAIEKSMCIVLVIDRSMESIRIARNFIEGVEIFLRSNQSPRRVFIALNESRPNGPASLSDDDIKALLNKDIDVFFPYNAAEPLANKKTFPFFTPQASLMQSFMHQLLGIRQAGKNQFSVLGALRSSLNKRKV